MARRPCHRSLVLLLLSRLARPSAAGGAGSQWYKYEYESDFFESLFVIGMLMVALTFESLWHALGHGIEHSYRYGKYHKQAQVQFTTEHKGHAKHHPQLYKELYNRIGGEMMILGILAFLVFILNQAEVFEQLADALPACGGDCFHRPSSGSDWLHLVELAHVKLFVGMCLYFGLVFCLVRGSVSQIAKWEKLRLRSVGAHEAVERTPSRNAADIDLEKHLLYRDYFLEHILIWRNDRPDVFKKIMDELHINPTAEDLEHLLREAFDDRFSLSAYMALNLENGVLDSIMIHKVTWAILLCVFSVFALLHREAHVALLTLVPGIIAVAFAIFCVIWFFSRQAQHKIEQFTRTCRQSKGEEPMAAMDSLEFHAAAEAAEWRKEVGSKKSQSIHERISTEFWLLCMLQVFLFLMAYVFAQTLLNIHVWKVDPMITLVNSLAFASLFFVLGRFLPSIIPVFMTMMSFPPYCDDDNLERFFAVLRDNGTTTRGGSVRKSKSVALPGVWDPTQWQHSAWEASFFSDEESSPASEHIHIDVAAVRELADLLGVSEMLEARLRERGLVNAHSDQRFDDF